MNPFEVFDKQMEGFMKKKPFLCRVLAILLLVSTLSVTACQPADIDQDSTLNSDVVNDSETTTLDETTELEQGSLQDPIPGVTNEPEKLTKPENPTQPLYVKTNSSHDADYNCTKITVLADYNTGVDYDIQAKELAGQKKMILFLPCRADLSAVTFLVTHKDGSVSGPYTADFSDEEISFNERFVNKKEASGKFISNEYVIEAIQSNLPTMMVQIDEQYVTIKQMTDDPDHKTFSYGDVVTTVTDEMAKENGWATRYVSEDSDPDKYCSADMRGRGNWNWKYPKRSYQVRTENNVDMLGMGRGKAWALLGIWNDCVGIRTQLAHALAENIGVHFTSAHRMVDLFLNGTYMGMYVITEKVEVAPNRVEIDEENDILFEVDQYYEEQGEFGFAFFDLGEKYYFRVHSPTEEGTVENSKQVLYTAMKALKSGDEKEFLKYFDLDSWARMLLVQLYTMNNDAYLGSFYFYYNSDDGKLYACSPWDFDWSFGNSPRSGSKYRDPMRQDYSDQGLSADLIKYPAFLEAVLNAYYKGGVKEEIAKMPALAREYGELCYRSILMNEIGASVNYQNVSNAADGLPYLYSVCEKRVEFMEQKMQAYAKQINYIP